MSSQERDSSEPERQPDAPQRQPSNTSPLAGLTGAALGQAGNAAVARLLAGTAGGVDRDAPTATQGGSLDSGVAQRIEASRGGGSALPDAVRAPLQQQLGADLSSMRVHTDAPADGLSRSVRATAFTTGSDVFFSSGSYQPGTTAGRELIAHEAVHVVQQGGGVARAAATTVSDPADAAETEAYRLAPLLARAIGNPATADLAQAEPSAAHRHVVHRAPGAAPAAPQVDPAVVPPFEVEWTWVIKHGSMDASKPRSENLIWVGDTLAVFARVSVPNAKDLGLRLSSASAGLAGSFGDATTTKPVWVNDRTAMWEISGTTPGVRSVGFTVTGPDGFSNERINDIDLTVGADVRLFKDRCSTAESVLNAKHAKAREWFMGCFLAYKAGYERQNAALERQAGADRLVGQILLGVLFAAVGGAAGGAVAQMASVKNAGKLLETQFGPMAQSAFTDAAKDVGKFVARLPTTAASASPQGKAGGGASTDPGKVGVAQGEQAPSAVDPLNWMATIDQRIAGERAAMGAVIADAHQRVDRLSITDPNYLFDRDPVELVNERATIDGKPIDALGEVPTALQYERACWEVWLANYAYKAQYYSGDVPFAAGYAVEGNVRRKLKEEIDKVAESFGETGDDWIKRYGAPAKAAAEAKVAKLND
jgi:hypothetical protein